MQPIVIQAPTKTATKSRNLANPPIGHHPESIMKTATACNLSLLLVIITLLVGGQQATAQVNYPATSTAIQQLAGDLYYGGFEVGSEGSQLESGNYLFLTQPVSPDGASCFSVSFGPAWGQGYRIPTIRIFGGSTEYSPTENTGFRLQGGGIAEYYGEMFIGGVKVFVLCSADINNPTNTYALFTWGTGAGIGSTGTTTDRAQFGSNQGGSTTYAGFSLLSMEISGTFGGRAKLLVDIDSAATYKVQFSRDLKSWVEVGVTQRKIIDGSQVSIAGVDFILVEVTPNVPADGLGTRGFYRLTN